MMLHIIEPTLNSYAGHCHSLVQALALEAPANAVKIWAGKSAKQFWQGPGQLECYFYRTLRKFQAVILYRRLLREPGKLLLSTAGTSDLIILDWVAQGLIPQSKVYLYIHWVGAKESKAAMLKQIAKRQPHIEILCTTSSVTKFFGELGFRARTVPYPRGSIRTNDETPQPFSHLLVAGAARIDKGFDRIVDLIADLERSGSKLPILVQTSSPHQNRYSAEILRQIDRLSHINYQHLRLLPTTLSPMNYQALFPGGISIQPYSEAAFQDRVSGVTLDALSAGCPVVVTSNTWLAVTILKFQAGVATNDLSPGGLLAAIAKIHADYSEFAERAAEAGRVLHLEHSARAMMNVVFEKEVACGA